MADTDTDLTIDDEEELLNFVLYFVLTCVAVFFTIILFFLCFSGRICVYIYYMVYNLQPSEQERAPLIVETEYFPRPGYDGYCLIGQEEPLLNHAEFSDIEDEAKTRTVILEAGLVLTKSISIGPSGPSRNYQELATPHTPTNFPRGILTPERSRRKTSRREQSFKAVSFNPKAEFKLLEDV